jgi:hypothetical protein
VTGAVALALHTSAYLLVTSGVAWVVYIRLGLGLLRTARFNLDWLWAAALIVTRCARALDVVKSVSKAAVSPIWARSPLRGG